VAPVCGSATLADPHTVNSKSLPTDLDDLGGATRSDRGRCDFSQYHTGDSRPFSVADTAISCCVSLATSPAKVTPLTCPFIYYLPIQGAGLVTQGGYRWTESLGSVTSAQHLLS